MKVAILGASQKPERYSNKALKALLAAGHEVIPINPAQKEIETIPCEPNLAALPPNSIHTLTIYLSPKHSTSLLAHILRLNPKRIIFNPGTENSELIEPLTKAGIEIIEGCTLVMLSIGTF